MSINERIYRIDQLLNDKKIVSFKELLNRLEISSATLKRDLAYMRDRLNAPIIFDRDLNGYRFDNTSSNYELPGLWFSAKEIYAILTMNHLLNNLDMNGLISSHIKPLQSRLMAILEGSGTSYDEIQKRVRIENVGSRSFNLDYFQEIGSALVNRKRLNIRYRSRGKEETTEREISPQRITYYKNNWYLDAWCHVKRELRSFSVDAIEHLVILEIAAQEISEDELNAELASGYGIFAGSKVQNAKLIFSQEKARWVAHENWHPDQQGEVQSDGRYILKVPYSDPRELIMDILKYGSGVEVVAPASLKDSLKQELLNMMKIYGANLES